ncbi:MAG: 30S ribosome-binding factor RbfA [Kiritimatiellia bacterium]
MSHRIERVNELIQREVATALFRIIPSSEFDPATVTITRVVTSPDLHTARIHVSVLGDEFAAQRSMSALFRHRREIQAHVGRAVVMKFTPRIEFVQDTSIEKGNRVLEILDRIEHPRATGTPPPARDEQP